MLTKREPILSPYQTSVSSRWPPLSVSATYLPLIERMRGVRESRPEPVALAFASVDRGAGTSYVTSRLSADLRLYTGDRVATCSALELRESGATPSVPLLPGDVPSSDNGGRSPKTDAIKLLQQQFDYILVDCPALRYSSDALVLSRRMDGLCLVIEAGRTTRSEVQSQLSAAALSGIRVFGLILNKRRYPVPDFIYRML
jgi:hypothetical protein